MIFNKHKLKLNHNPIKLKSTTLVILKDLI